MSDKAPIIIKRKRVIQGGGHHGGAWKVAYADFVTAMMAFFLLMWLLNATTEEQRKGLADYFNPSIPIAAVSGGGTDTLNGDSVTTAEELISNGTATTPEPSRAPLPPEEAIEAAVEKLAKEAGIDDSEGRVQVRKTDEGTVIELVDVEGNPLFEKGSAAPSDDLRRLVAAAAAIVRKTGVEVKITGHTDAIGFATPSYTNWELSADRANTARRLLLAAGVSPDKIGEVAGMADREPIVPDRKDPANRRIAIILRDPTIEEEERARLRR